MTKILYNKTKCCCYCYLNLVVRFIIFCFSTLISFYYIWVDANHLDYQFTVSFEKFTSPWYLLPPIWNPSHRQFLRWCLKLFPSSIPTPPLSFLWYLYDEINLKTFCFQAIACFFLYVAWNSYSVCVVSSLDCST